MLWISGFVTLAIVMNIILLQTTVLNGENCRVNQAADQGLLSSPRFFLGFLFSLPPCAVCMSENEIMDEAQRKCIMTCPVGSGPALVDPFMTQSRTCEKCSKSLKNC